MAMMNKPAAADPPEGAPEPELPANATEITRSVDDDGVPTVLEERLDQALEQLVEPDKREVIVKTVELVIAEEHFAGPLPHPKHFQHYGEVEPSAPGRILSMVEKELDFQQNRHRKALSADIAAHFCGLILGFIICLCLVGGAIYLADKGQVAVPTLLLGAAALSAVKTFVNANWRKAPAPPPPAPVKTPPKTPAKPAGKNRSRRR